MKKHEPQPGAHVAKECERLVQLVMESGETASMVFNDVELVAEPGTTAGDLLQRWSDEVHRLRAEYEQSPEGIADKQWLEEFAARAAESEAEGIVEFDIVDHKAWDECVAANQDGGYCEAVLRYAARWARLMDKQVARGATVESVAESAASEADTEGMTGFMHGCAVWILAKVWRHGESLRRWHNLNTQMRDEGKRANETGGVLSPAMLSVQAGKEQSE